MNLNACRQHTWMMTLLCVGHCFCAVSITQSSTNVVKGSSLNIIATLDEDGLSWTFKGGTPLTTCSLSFNGCLPSMDKNMVFSASSITNTSTISIASLNCSINTAIYVARTDSSQTDTVDIDVTTPVSSILSTTVLTTSKVQSQDLSVEVECVYPMSTITANFTISRSVKPDDILFPDSIQTSTSSSGCECSEATYVVKKTITASQYPNEVVQVQANIGHLSPLVIGDVNFTAGQSTDSCDSNYWHCIGYILLAVFIASGICTVVVVVWWGKKRKDIKAKSILCWLTEHIFCCCAQKIKSCCEKYKNKNTWGTPALLLLDVFVIGVVIWLFSIIAVICLCCTCKESQMKCKAAGICLSLIASALGTAIVLIVCRKASCCRHKLNEN